MPQKTADLTAFVDNILSVYYASSLNQRQAGRDWYNSAREISLELSVLHSVPLLKTAGIVAALSPMKSWTQNVKDAQRILTNLSSGISAEKSGGTFGSNLRKCDAIYNLPDDCTMSDILIVLNGQKIKSFFACIVDLETSDVCIDGHAYHIATFGLDRRAIPDAPGMGVRAYANFQKAYSLAAQRLEIPASVLQAVTWVTYKEILIKK